MRFLKYKDVRYWLIAFLIAALILGLSIAGFYAYTPVKLHIFTRLLRHNMTSRWAWGRIYAEGEDAVPCFVKGLCSKNPEVRSTSEMALVSLAYAGTKGEIAVPALIELLSHPDAEVRSKAASCLGAFADKRALPDLLKLLSDSHARVRCSAADALGRMGDKKAVPDLVKLLSDPDDRVRYWTAEALGKIGSDQAVGPLISSLSDPDLSVRQAATGALGRIGSDKAVGPLIACLKEKPMKNVRSGRWARFKSNAIGALEKITSQSFGDYRRAASDPEDQGQEIIQKWQNWWEENEEKFQEPESE